MIGNDLHTDIAGAENAGIDTLYMHTNLTPPDQRSANSALETPHHLEFEGYDWRVLVQRILAL
jgi:ribonucleotide monophosphatase NagD (HAD superfamily)